jgi:predicted secreted Zn-dependent protease
VASAHPEVVRRIEEIMRAARTDSKEFPVREGAPGGRKKKTG